MKIALLGNPNSGKTTLFNALTDSHEHTGNFAGVTIEKKTGRIKNEKDLRVTDLPGIYSLTPYSPEEKTASDFLKNESPDLILNIIDLTNFQRNLYLTLQLLEYNIPVVIALNFHDEFEKRGGILYKEKLEKLLGCKCVFICAYTGKGIKSLTEEIKQTQKKRCPVNIQKKCNDYEETAKLRYNCIDDIIKICVKKKPDTKSFNADIILTNKFLSYILFFVFLGIMFFIVFGPIGTFFTDFLSRTIDYSIILVKSLFKNMGISNVITSFVTDGIMVGIGNVLEFIPVFILLFLFLGILEDSGYMARIAFISDMAMKKISLTGKSIIPLLLGMGCSVPAISSTKTIREKNERKMTVFLIPFIPCSAKIPVFAYIGALCFGKRNFVLFILCLYITAVFFASLTGYISNIKSSKPENSFIMEMPPYRLPKMRNVFKNIYEKTAEFCKKVFTVIFIFTVVIYFMKTFDTNLNYTSCVEESILCTISKKLTFLFEPLGFGDWRIIAALISGLGAKEAILSTFSILLPQNTLNSLLSPLPMVSLCLFILFYTPCIGALSAIKKEQGLKEALKTGTFQFIYAWCFSFVFYNIFSLFFRII